MTQLVFPGEYFTLTPNHSHEKALGPQWGGVVVLVVDQGHDRFVFGLEFELSQLDHTGTSLRPTPRPSILSQFGHIFVRAEYDGLPFLAMLL